ncbi:c-type cytochrome [Methylopila sp. M107]|uniref:c-type cytochrome n=1 Tax=Methylopila sp. M107 TaxID=1101190 RepID=UPI000378B5BD|nr:c-type cytochrome [Methylopila sp. M107]
MTMHRVTIAALGLAGLAVAGPAFAEPFRDDAFATYKGDPKNGAYVAGAAGCAACHSSGDDPKLLSGGLKMDTFIGTLFASNITADPAGIGGWSNAQFLNATMRGIGKDGRHLYPVMPYASYAGMNPTDMLDVKAYLETLPKSDARTEANRISWPYNMSVTMNLWKRANLDETAFAPGDGSQLARGRYLVEAVGGCGECHTPRTGLYGLDKTRAFQGEKGLSGGAALDISKSRIASVGDATFAKRLFEDGTKLSGAPFGDPVMRKIAQGLSGLTDADRRAVVAYLKGAEVQAPKVADTAEAACKDPTAQAATAGADPGLARAADDFMTNHCRNCHGPGASAQGSYPAGDLPSIAADAAFLTPGDAANSAVFKSIKSGRMPKGKQPSAAEIDAFGKWIDSLKQPAPIAASALAGPPRKRAIVDWRGYTLAAAGDIGKVQDADKPFVRYFSFRPQQNGVLPCEDQKRFAERMKLYDAGFNKLLNSLSLGESLVTPDKVDGAPAPLARVDIRDLGWDAAKWDALVASYPYALDPSGGDGSLQALAAQTRTQVPILRVDWFMANAAKPALYHTLLDLPQNIADLEKGRLGVNVDDNIRRRRIVRAAFLQGASGVSDHNRMIERHALPRGGYYWKSYDFAESRNLQDLTKRPHGPPEIGQLEQGLESFHHDGGEMIFQLPNGLQGYYLSTAKGDRLDEGPTSIVSFRDRPVGRVGGVIVSNGKTCFACHVDGIIAKRDQLRSKIETTFPAGQRELLLDMYVPQKQLEATYDADRKAFVAALDKIGATQTAPDGTRTSATGPGKEEIVNWFADLYEDNLDAEALASEFDMTAEQFQTAASLVRDPVQSQLVILWQTQLKTGAKVPRFEVEQQFAALSKPLLGVQALEAKPLAKQALAPTGAAPVPAVAPALPDYKNPAMQTDGPAGKLTLELKVASSNVFVGQELHFDVTANRACELQVFYVEETGNVEVISQALIGAPFLEAGVPRRIPDPRGGSLVFDTPGRDESLVLFCREGGLREQRLSAEQAKALASVSRGAPTRGLAQKLTEQNAAPSAPATITSLSSPAAARPAAGGSAVHIVTFNVKGH